MPFCRGYGGIWGLVALVVAVSIFACGIGRSQPKRPIVFVATDEQKKEVSALLEAVLGQLVDQPVSSELLWMSDLPTSLPKQLEIADELGREHQAIAVFWLTLDENEVVHLYLTVPRSGRVTYRRLSSDDGVLGEVLGVIVRTSVGSILAGGDVEVALGESSTVQIAKAQPAEVAPIRDEKNVVPGPPGDDLERSIVAQDPGQASKIKGPQLGIEAGYRFESYSKKHPALSGISVGLSVRFASHWAITARTAFVLTELAVDKKTVALELRRHPSSLDLYLFDSFGAFDLGVAAGFGLDVVDEEVSTIDDLEPYGSRREIIFSGFLELRSEMRVWADLFAWASAGVHVPFNPVDYVARTPAGEMTVAQSFVVRPVALVGLTYRPF